MSALESMRECPTMELATGHYVHRVHAESVAAEADARIAALEADNAELREVLTKAREDINWMVNSGTTLNGFVFDYIDAALATQPKGETNE